jgi:hypothetical protein
MSGTAITWSLGKSVSAVCFDLGAVPAMVSYGYPTAFYCRDTSNNTVGPERSNTPSCPDGTYADFALQLCMPFASGSVASSDASISSSDIATVWSAAFGLVVFCYFIGRAVGAVLDMLKKG